MKSEYERIKDIYFSALGLPETARAEFVSSSALSEQERQEVNSLLDAEGEAGSFLSDGSALDAVQASYGQSDEKLIGEYIGGYKILREIGRGGMGVVYLAEREAFHQQVAVKIIKRGMDTDAIVESFVRERQILAALNHRYIANLFDGGTTTDGRPYFVMEFVEGIAIDKFCENLDRSRQIEIFVKVCSAVSFAHAKLIVHRDLKPSNILINANKDPKLLDFGIAKLLDADERTATRTALRAMTPEYASPEQISGGIVGTETDVYSLGRVLQKILRNDSEDQGSEKQHRKLPSDLSNILAKALHKETGRRYRSVEAFAADLRLYLENKPITAKPDSLGYRSSKFVQRNRLVVSFGLIVLLTLIVGMGATLWKAREAQAERALAERRFENLRKLSDSMITELHSAIRDLPGSLPARQLLLTRAKEQLDTLAEESGDNEVLLDELGQAYYNLAQLPDVSISERKAANQKAVAAYTRLLSKHPGNLRFHFQLARAELTLADSLKMLGKIGEAYQHCQTAVLILENVEAAEPANKDYVENLLSGVYELAYYESARGDFESSTQVSKRAREVSSRLTLLDPDNARLIEIRLQISGSGSLIQLGRYDEAEAELLPALASLTGELDEHPHDTTVLYRTWSAKRRLGTIALNRGEVDAAVRLTSEALTIMQGLMASSPRDVGYQRNTAITHILLGSSLMSSRRVADALPNFTRALELSEGVVKIDPEHFESRTDLARALACVGNALANSGQKAKAVPHLSRAVVMYGDLVKTDTENAVLQRDFAEASYWMADAIRHEQPQIAKIFQDSAAQVWAILKAHRKLSAADLAAH